MKFEIVPSYVFIVLILLSVVVISFLIFRLFQSEKRRKSAEESFKELESKVNKLELQTLESKLSPHLFKNILNSIQSHAYQTYYSMDKLANVLDYILYESNKKFVTPKEEIEFALNLIEINKIKLSPLFQLDVKVKVRDTEPLYEQCLLAPLISLDLIENAFKHADLQSADSFISVTFVFKDNIFSITVANKISSKKPIVKEKKGIGVETLNQRLNIIYSDNYSLDRFVENDDVYISHLKINLFEHKVKMRTAR